eukprot:tig00020909_g15349.t1
MLAPRPAGVQPAAPSSGVWAATLILLISLASSVHGGTITNVLPSSGPLAGGNTITLAVDINTAQSTSDISSITFGGASATSWTYSSQRIVVAVPPPPGGYTAGTAVNIVIVSQTLGTTQASGAYTYNPPTTITSIVPTSAGNQGGSVITLYGTNLPFYADIVSVTIAGVQATATPLSISDKGGTFIRVTLPTISAALAGSVSITEISTTYGTVTASGFTLLAITTVTPSSGAYAGGTRVTISGSFANVVNKNSVTSVKFGGITATVERASTTEIEVTTGAGTPADDTVSVVILNGAPVTKTLAYRYVALSAVVPIISPTAGPLAGGNVLTIYGTFGVTIDDASVLCTIGGVTATVASEAGGAQPTQVAVRVPAGAAPGPVSVTIKIGTGATMTSGQTYTYNVVPQLGSIVPSTGDWAGGNTVTITAASGFVLGSGSDIRTVVIGGFQATSIVSQTTTSVVAVVGSASSSASAGLASVAVISDSFGRSTDLTGQYAFTAITGLSIVNGPLNVAGVSLTITGSFTFVTGPSSVAASIQSLSATVTAASTTSIQVTVPSSGAVAGVADVSVSVIRNGNTGGPSVSVAGYHFISIINVNPRSGPFTGGNTISMNGIYDTRASAGAYSCAVGGVAGTISGTATGSVVRCIVPAGTPGAAWPTVQTANGAPITAPQTYSYVAVTGAVPSTGPASGGNTVTIQGTFMNATSTAVTFNGASAAVVVGSTTATQIVVTAPVGSAGNVNVSVVITSGSVATVAAVYSYVSVSTPLTPTNGPVVGGNSITIAGSFPGVTSPGNVAVSFSGTAATVTSASSTQIIVTAPSMVLAGAGAKSVSVTVRSGSPVTLSNAYTFNAAPSITSVSPASGPWYGGRNVTISGSNLGNGADVTSVTIGSISCTIVSQSSSSVICTTGSTGSSGAAGAFNVTIVSSTFGVSTLASGYAYQAITSISPRTAGATGTHSITITGTFVGASGGPSVTVSFTKPPSTTVTVASGSISAADRTTIIFAAPDGSSITGDNDVAVVVGAGDAVVLSSGYAFLSPLEIQPITGAYAGGNSVTLSGTWGTISASDSVTVLFGNTPVDLFTGIVSRSPLVVRSPARNAAGAVNVTMKLRDPAEFVLVGTFTYNAQPSIASVTPSTGPASGSYRITIAGTNLAADSGDVTSVSIVGFSATAVLNLASKTSVVVQLAVPSSNSSFVGIGNVVLTSTTYGTSVGTNRFTFVSANSITPRNGGWNAAAALTTSGSTSKSITISGYFGATTPSSARLIMIASGYSTAFVTANSPLSTTSLVFNLPSIASSSRAGYVNVSLAVVFGTGASANVGQPIIMPNAFYYTRITSCVPSSMPLSGGLTVTSTGLFDINPTVADVTVDVQVPPSSLSTVWNPATVLSATSTTITWIAPNSTAAGRSNVRIRVFNGIYVSSWISDISGTGIAYNSITGITPSSGPSVSAAAATITVSGIFSSASGVPQTASTVVQVNGATRTTLSASASLITFLLPAGTYTEGFANISITINNPTTPVQAGSAVVASSLYAFVKISSVSPAVGPLAGGNIVTILGTFSQVTSAANVRTVLFGANAANVISATSTGIVVTAPAAASSGSVTLSVTLTSGGLDGNATTKATAYSYNVAGSISTVAPVNGPLLGGARTTVTGTNIGSGSDITAVLFGGENSTIVSQTSRQVVVDTGPGSAAGTVSVSVVSTAFGTSTKAASYTFASITSVTPDNGPTTGGNSVTIVGSLADAAQASDLVVKLGTLAATITDFSVVGGTSTVTVTAPSAVGQTVTTDVEVTIKGQSPVTAFDGYIFQRIASVEPANGPLAGGNSVTLVGQLRVSSPSQCVIALSGQLTGTVTPTSIATLGSSKGVVFTVPGGAAAQGTVNVALSINGGSALTATYTLNPAAVITSVSPTTGPIAGGVRVTITGTNLNNGSDIVSVTLNGVQASVFSQSATQVVAVTGATPLSTANGFAAVVTTSTAFGVATLPSSYAYIGVSSLLPASGPGTNMNRVTIFGSFFGFSSPSQVVATVGGSAATVDVAQSGFIIMRTAAQPAINTNEAVSITTTAGGAPTISPVNFAYLNVTTVVPARGPRAGGNSVTLTGCFGTAATTGNTAVSVQSSAAAVVSVSSSQVVVRPAAGTAGAATIAVTVANGYTLSVSGLYTLMQDPSINAASITPASGPWSGGTSVSLTGTNLGSGTDIFSVTVGGVPAASITSQTDSGVTFVTGSLASPSLGGRKDIVVTSLFFGNATAANAFAYTAISSVVPSSGPVGGSNAITLLGYFGLTGIADVTTSTVGGSAATVSSVDFSSSPEKIVLSQPAVAQSAGAATVSVAIRGGAAVTATYAYTEITSISPATGPIDATVVVTISGSFGSATASTVQVTVNGTRAGINSASGTQIVARFPASSVAGAVDVAVTVSGGLATTSVNGFGYVAVTSVDKASAPPNSPLSVVVSGTFPGLSSNSGAAVLFQGVAATITAVTASSITATLPAAGVSAGPADVSVQLLQPNAGVAHVASAPFAYLQIDSIVPATGPKAGGNTVTLNGVFPGASLSPAPTVTLFGSAASAVLSVSSSRIVFTAPALSTTGLGSSTVALRYAGAAADGLPATLSNGYTSVEITSVTPQAVPSAGGASVTLAGSFMGAAAQSDVAVTVNGTSATIVSASATEVVFTAPAGVSAGSVPVLLRLKGGAPVSAPSQLIYSSIAITSVVPNNGPAAGGNTVTINGASLTISATPTVKLANVAVASVTSSSSTSIVVVAAAGSGTGDVYVFSSDTGSATLAGGYTYNAGSCTITSITPSRGPLVGGNTVTIDGASLTNGADLTSVTIGGVAASCGTTTATRLVCTVGDGTSGGSRQATLVVTSASGGTCQSPNAYFYAPPNAITSVVPGEGPIAGGTTVTITGSNLSDGLSDVDVTSVQYGGVPVERVESASSTRVVVVTANSAAAGSPPVTVDVVLVSAVHGTATLASAFKFNPPGAITSVTPAEGPLRGGVPADHAYLSVTVQGTNLCSGVSDVWAATLAGIPILRVVSASTTQIVVVPGSANATATGPVVVTSAAYGVTTSAATYTINPLPVISGVSPSSGLITGGDNITISGANLAHDAADLIYVRVKGVAVAAVVSASATQIVVTTGDGTPGGPAAWGSGAVSTLSRAFGYAASAADLFLYLPTVSIVVTGAGPDLWSVGSTAPVRWVWSGTIPTVNVVVESCASSAVVETVASNAINVGTLSLVVPYVSPSVGTVRVRVSSGQDDRVFGLSACRLVVGQSTTSTVIEPISSTSATKSTPVRIRWYPSASAGLSVNVVLRSATDGTTLATLASNVPNSGALTATLPNVSGNAYVEVLPAAGPGVSVAATFAIS